MQIFLYHYLLSAPASLHPLPSRSESAQSGCSEVGHKDTPMACQTYSFFTLALALLPFAVLEADALNYASVKSGDNFELKWAYSNNMLMFNMTCKTTGWCAVAFTTNPGGRGMVNYDIVVGGFASNMSYLKVSLHL